MNETEFAEKIQSMRKQLYRTAYLYLGSEADALEALDEAVFKALVSLKKLNQPEFFSTWMTRILINQCKNELKRRRRLVPIDEIPESSDEQFDALPLNDAIARLPQELKEPLILRYFQGFTTVETAEILSIPLGTSATRIRKALKLLRLELSEEENTYE